MSVTRRTILAGLGATTFYMPHARAREQIMDEAMARKARSEAILEREGVPYNPHLPLLETVSEARFRSVEETANRALSLLLVAGMGETGDYNMIQRLIDEWGVRPHFSPVELAFVNTRAPSQHDRIQFSWRYEALSPLVWALSFPHEPGRPDHIVDVGALVGFMREQGPHQLRANARLRGGAEILDMLDLIYRYHWAVVESRLHGQETPGSIDGGVVMERHYALNWLTCYADEAWDDVSTDT